MVGHWYVGLSGGSAMWVKAEEALVEEGCLILSRRTPDGTPRIAMTLAPGEWTCLKRDKVYPASDANFEALCDRIYSTRPPRVWTGPAVLCRLERRHKRDRRGTGSPTMWNGIERRCGRDQRAG